MKPSRLLPLLAALLLAAGCQTPTPPLPAASVDGRVTVIFDKPDEFTAAKSSYNMGTDHGYLDELHRYIDRESRVYLADGQRLTVTFTDIDLAGDFRPDRARADNIRIIKEIYRPRLQFSYSVADATGKVINSGEENLTDMNFMSRLRMSHSEELFYEKAMLKDWMGAKLHKN